MDILIDFLINNYIWFLVISLILIFALIGYLVDVTTPKLDKKNNKVKPIIKDDRESNNFHVHPSMEAYKNEEFDDPLIK